MMAGIYVGSNSGLPTHISGMNCVSLGALCGPPDLRSKIQLYEAFMVTVADIKKDLPAWPEDVIEQWLHYFANEPDCGWPPPDPLGDHRWSGILGGRPLSWWKQVTWNKKTVDCGLVNLSNKSVSIVTEIIAHYNNKTADAVTTRRFKHAYIYIMDHAAFPKPVIMMKV
jgi:hypothetical protein